jgi:hypothetical protein
MASFASPLARKHTSGRQAVAPRGYRGLTALASLSMAVCAVRNPRLFAAIALKIENHPIVNTTNIAADFALESMRTSA